MPSDFKKEKEMEVLLKEYGTLRAEIPQYLGTQVQLINIALLSSVGLIAVFPFLISLDSRGLHLAVSPLYFVIVLLAISLLFTSFAWAYLLQLFTLACIGKYCNQVIRTRVCRLLEMESLCELLTWDRYHIQQYAPRFLKSIFNKSAVGMLSLSPFIIILIPSLITSIAAIWIYVSSFSVLTSDIGKWFALGLIIFDMAYFELLAPCGVYVLRVYEEIN